MRRLSFAAVAAGALTLCAHSAGAGEFNDRFAVAPPTRGDAFAALERKNGTTEGRARFAREYENSLLGRGIDMHATSAGNENRTLLLRWIGFGRPAVYQLLNKTDFLARMKRYGFDRIEITDGETATWRLRRSGNRFALY